jgi:hypothetical protein
VLRIMKFLISLALCALLSCVSLSPVNRPQQPIRLTQGQTYLYEYKGRLLTGIPELANQYSGFEIMSDLILQPISESVVAFKLSNVRIGQHNGQVPINYQQYFVMNHLPDPQYTKELTKPIRFVYNDGKVVAFEADQSEPEWSLNIKKSILSLFNINLTPKKIIRSVNNNQVPKIDLDITVYPVYEEGIGGICETVYEINNIPYINDLDSEQEFVLNVTKTRNYRNCLTEPTIVNDNFDVRGCPSVCRKEKSFAAVPGYYPTPDDVNDPYMSGCPCGQEPQESPVESFNYVYYNISLQQPNPIIENIYSEGKVSYNSYGDELLVIVQQNVSLVEAGAVAAQIQSIPRPQRHNELAFRLPKPQLPAGPKAPLDIPYYHLFGQPNVAELSNVIPELLDSLASDIVAGDVAVSKDSMAKSVQIVNALAVLPVTALEQLFEDVAQEGQSYRASPKQQVVRKLFLDSLPLAGSNQAAIFIKFLIEQNKVTTYEAKELVEAVPQNLFLPDIATIDAYLDLFQNPKVQNRRHLAASTGIAFGKMVKEACVKRQYTPGDIPDDNNVPYNKRNLPAQLVVQPSDPQNPQRVKVQQVPAVLVTSQQRTGFSGRMKRSATWESAFNQDVCDEQDIQRYVQIIGRLFQQNQQYYKKMALIETLAHMGVYQVLPYFEPYISGEVSQQSCPGYVVEHPSRNGEECDFVRQVIIYALAHITEYYPKQVLPLVLPVYNNPSNSYEIRIAAFTTLIFADADRQVLERIASQLYFEGNRQVQSFVYSALQTIGNFSLPCFEKMARNADFAYNHAPNIEYGMQYSKMLGADYYDAARDYGLYTLTEWVSSNISQIPRSGYFSVGQSNGPFQDELLQFGFNAKGVESLIKRVLEPNGLLSDMFEGMQAKSKDRRINKRNTDSVQQALEALKNKLNLNYRTDDEPKATIFFKLFDRTSYYPLDRAYIHQLIDDAEDSLKDIAAALTQGANFHYVKLIMPSQLYKVVPSELGLPVVITHRHPMIFSIKVDNAKIQMATGQKTIYPIGVNFTALVQPSFYYSSYSFMFAINPANRQSYGVHVEKTTQVTLPAEVSIGYVRPKNLFTSSFVPKLPNEVVYHKTQASTFIAKASIAGAPDRNWLQDAEPIKTMAVPFQYDNEVGQQLLGLGVRVQLNSENVWYDQPFYLSPTANTRGYIPALVEGFRNPGSRARELHVQLQPDQNEPVYGYDFSLRYKWVAEDEEGADDDDSDESSASNESDSDESDESSASKSSESKSSESRSSKSKKKSSQRSSQSSQQSDESGLLKTKTGSQIKRKIKARFSKVIEPSQSQLNQQHNRNRNGNNQNVNENERNNRNENNDQRQESNESSDESSNESGSKSSSRSGSKASSQSSSSESNSSELKRKNRHNNNNQHNNQHNQNNNEHNNQNKNGQRRQRRESQSHSAQSSESSSSSSSASDESSSFEDSVFDYDDVMRLILGQDFRKRSIKRISRELVHKTRSAWEWAWDEDDDESSSDESNQDEQSQVPATIAHDFALTAVARGPRPTYYAANVLYVHTYDHRTIWLKSDGHIKSPVGVYMQVPTLFCADAVIAYPVYPGEFYYDPTSMQAQRAKIQAQAGWGPQCQNEGGVIVTGVMETTEDHVIPFNRLAVQDGASPLHVQNWYYSQCRIDRAEGQPLSYACERSIIEESYFNQIILDVKYKNLPKQFLNATQKLDLALKVAYYQNLQNNYLDVDNPDNQIRLVAQYSSRVPNVPLANLLVKKPRENSQFSKIYVPYLRPVSSLLPYREIYANLITDYQSTDTCNLMEDYVRTFDNVTYKIPDNPCQYLVAKDCSPYERFAIYASQLDQEAKTKAVTIVANGIEIKLTPPTQQNLLQVVVDGRTHELTARKPITLEGNKNDIRIYLRMTRSEAVNPIAVVEIDNQNLQVLYDGKNAKVLIGNQYQGVTCGLCGDNNDEATDEFSGPDQCIYEDSYDFANSYALSGLHCEQVPVPDGQKRCPLHQKFFSQNQQQQSQEDVNNQESAIVNKKVVKVVQTPQGQTTLVKQEENQQLGQRDRQNVLQVESNVEELNRKQQELQDRVRAKQNGQDLSPEQDQTLYGANAQQQKILSRMRTHYIERDDMICFTTKPVLECFNSVAVSTTQQLLNFHCLPKDSQFTQQLVIDAQRQVIKQLANKRVDIRQTVIVPVSCVAHDVAVVRSV